MYSKMKRKDDHRVLKVEGPQDAANSVLWQAGVQGWRSALGLVWQELSSWESMSTYGITMHELAWKLSTRLLEQNVWSASEGSLTSWQAALGKHHTEWMVAKCVEHMRERYAQGKAGRTGNKPTLLHSLKCVAAIPSIETCAAPLVQ